MSIASLRFYVIKLCNRALPQSVYGLVVVLGGSGCEVCEGDLEGFVGFLCVVVGGCDWFGGFSCWGVVVRRRFRGGRCGWGVLC